MPICLVRSAFVSCHANGAFVAWPLNFALISLHGFNLPAFACAVKMAVCQAV